uniref:ORF53 n=1 Tax=Nitrosopumilaceae spindle-shaped virus TaxID=3065433 RepID=A0AAT9JA91_9VIRU
MSAKSSSTKDNNGLDEGGSVGDISLMGQRGSKPQALITFQKESPRE